MQGLDRDFDAAHGVAREVHHAEPAAELADELVLVDAAEYRPAGGGGGIVHGDAFVLIADRNHLGKSVFPNAIVASHKDGGIVTDRNMVGSAFGTHGKIPDVIRRTHDGRFPSRFRNRSNRG